MKFKQGKKLIISLLCAMVMLLISFSCLNVVAVRQKNEDKGDPQAADAFVFDNENDNPDDVYSDTWTFHIANAGGLKAFAHSITEGKHGYTDKTVKLTNHITIDPFLPIGCEWHWDNGLQSVTTAEEDYFQGTFDGQGYKITASLNSAGRFKTEIGDYAFGLFARTKNATIVNLRLSINFDAKFEGTNGGALNANVYIGGIVGHATKTTIENCAVESFSLTTNYLSYTKLKEFGGIAGYLEGKITNCYVSDFVTDIKMLGTPDGGLLLAGIANASNVSSCVINNGSYIAVNSIDRVLHPGKYEKWKIKFTDSINGNTIDNISNQNFICSLTAPWGSNNLYTTAISRTHFDIPISSDWYEAPNEFGFNGGVPYPKMLLDTRNCRFLKNGANNLGKVCVIGENKHQSKSPLKDPAEDDIFFEIAWYKYTKDPYKVDGKVQINMDEDLELGGVRVQAIPNPGYKFSYYNWMDDEYKNTCQPNHRANFVKETYSVNFDISVPEGCEIYEENDILLENLQTNSNIQLSYIYNTENKQLIIYVDDKVLATVSDMLLLKSKEDIETDIDDNSGVWYDYEVLTDPIEINENNIKIIDLGRDGSSTQITIKLSLKSYGLEVN